MTFDPRTHYQDDSVARSYDRERFASLAGRVFAKAERAALGRWLRRLPRGSLVLDAPCGTGRVARMLLDRGFRVSGVDLSHEMLRVSAARLGSVARGLQLQRADISRLPFRDGQFDAVLSIRFLPHFSADSRRAMLREMARVTKRWVLVSLSFSSPWYGARRALKKRLGHQAPTRYPVTEDELRRDLAAAGLTESARHWTLRFVSEEVLVVCEKASA